MTKEGGRSILGGVGLGVFWCCCGFVFWGLGGLERARKETYRGKEKNSSQKGDGDYQTSSSHQIEYQRELSLSKEEMELRPWGRRGGIYSPSMKLRERLLYLLNGMCNVSKEGNKAERKGRA